MTYHYPDDPIRSSTCIWVVSDLSSVWNFCTGFSDVISRGNQWWHCKMLAIFSVYCYYCKWWCTAVYLFECRGVEEVGNTVKGFEAVLPNLTQYLFELTVQLINVFSTLSRRGSSLCGSHKRERGRGREKRAKVWKREGSACFKSRCFCIPPTNSLTNLITSTVYKWPITSRGLLSMVQT